MSTPPQKETRLRIILSHVLILIGSSITFVLAAITLLTLLIGELTMHTIDRFSGEHAFLSNFYACDVTYG